MEPTIKTKNNSKIIILIVILIIIIIGVMVAGRNKTEAPVNSTPYGVSNGDGTSAEKNQLQGEVNSAVNFDNESSLQELDKEFQ